MRTLCLLFLFAALTVPSFAQIAPPVVGQPGTPTTRSIEGTVLSTTGSPVSGAVVLLKDTKTLQVRSYIAQQDGKYRFYGLSTDVNWELRAQANGMTSKTKTVSVFDSHTKVVLNLKLNKKLKT
ncbi:MAG: carboxypeptidase regulatory-like domain-containing protein [Acidobacteriaceae bacterium]|nr:carboxypeptidase regulatory-like domain-containing protein [Acidobacteriaceae bacterium]MBV9296250.1 carboxypeptidase regulatory-like domain-containing protein [Acidobacteriaceae bacterium]MBV9764032.1 carboxypeptidase regulatory-like domain-containing protein [Acidobacteriaceae bacterium]